MAVVQAATSPPGPVRVNASELWLVSQRRVWPEPALVLTSGVVPDMAAMAPTATTAVSETGWPGSAEMTESPGGVARRAAAVMHKFS